MEQVRTRQHAVRVSEEHIGRQFRQIPLYLQELFGEISQHYTSEPVNYSYLVNQFLVSAFERVAFVTLNYDLFLEKTLQSIDQAGPIQEHDWYIRSNWLLVKLRGSVNWGRKIRLPPQNSRTGELERAATEQKIVPLIGEIDTRRNLEAEIAILPGHQDRWKNGEPYYPAIAVPVEGIYEYICPPEHVEELRRFLRDCKNVLVVGVSGKDQDLLDLLKESMPRPTRFWLIGGDNQSVVESMAQFASIPQLSWMETLYKPDGVVRERMVEIGPVRFHAFTGGFSDFIVREGLEEFVAQAEEQE